MTGTIAPDPDGAGPLRHLAVRNSYDSSGRLVKVEKGELADWQSETVEPRFWPGFSIQQIVDTAYDPMGRKLSDRLSGGGAVHTLTQYSYDGLGRLECTAVRMNPAAFASPPASACALGAQGSEGPDRITRLVYDGAGTRVAKVRKAYATPLQQDEASYEYTPNGRQKAVIDANGNRAELRYDSLDRQSCWIFPSTATAGAVGGDCSTGDFEAYGYDSNDNRTSLRKRDGSTLTYQYDALNRMTAKIVPERAGLAAAHSRDVYYDYDLRGLMTKARFDSLAGEGVTNLYDGFGRLVSSSSSMGGIARTVGNAYDANGNRIRVTHPDGAYFTYDHDGLDRPTVVRENGGAPIATFGYDNTGRRASSGWAATTSYAYDPAGRLQTLSHNPAGTARDHILGFAYNPASQIVTRSVSNDAYAWTGAYNVSRGHAVNGLNQYTSAGPATFSHDMNGNLRSTVSGAYWTHYAYDVENRLVSASGTHNATLTYDPLGRLWQVWGETGL